MRLVVGMLAILGAGALALADAPSPTPTQSATTTATPPAPAASPAHETTAAMDPREKILRSKGYRLEVRHGEKMYCRNEEVLGSRLGGKKVCGTVADLEEREHLSRDMTESAQRLQLNPTGK
jgi:hypothetical protein